MMRPTKPPNPKPVKPSKPVKGRDVLFAELAVEKTHQPSTRKPRKTAADDEDADWQPSPPRTVSKKSLPRISRSRGDEDADWVPSPSRSGSQKSVSRSRGVNASHLADLPPLADDTDEDDEDDDVEDDVVDVDDELENDSEEDQNVDAGKGKGRRGGKGGKRGKGGKGAKNGKRGKRARVHRSHLLRKARAPPKLPTYDGLRPEELEWWKKVLGRSEVEQSFFGTRGNEGFR